MGFRILELGFGRNRSGLLRSVILISIVSALLALTLPNLANAQASDVVDLLVSQRSEARVAELLEELGGHAVPRPHIWMGELNSYWLWFDHNMARRAAHADSLRAAEAQVIAAAQALGMNPIQWRKFAAEEQGVFLEHYKEVFWRAIGTPHPSDTLATSHFRARLNNVFGAPTRNAAAMEQEGYAGSDYVQFEYWLIANDSIPVLVLDLDGPFGRGLLIASDEAFIDDFPVLKDDLIERILDSSPVPFADYYNSLERDQWYRTGFDGTEYFVRETRRPRWANRRSREEKWRIFR